MPRKKPKKLNNSFASQLVNLNVPFYLYKPENPNDEKCIYEVVADVYTYWDYALEHFLRKTWNSKHRNPELIDNPTARKAIKPTGSLLVSLYELLIRIHPLWRSYFGIPHLYLDAGDWFKRCFIDLRGTEIVRILNDEANQFDPEKLSTRQRIYAVERQIYDYLKKGKENPYTRFSTATGMTSFIWLMIVINHDPSTNQFDKPWNDFLNKYLEHIKSYKENPFLFQRNYKAKLAIQFSKAYGKDQRENKRYL